MKILYHWAKLMMLALIILFQMFAITGFEKTAVQGWQCFLIAIVVEIIAEGALWLALKAIPKRLVAKLKTNVPTNKEAGLLLVLYVWLVGGLLAGAALFALAAWWPLMFPKVTHVVTAGIMGMGTLFIKGAFSVWTNTPMLLIPWQFEGRPKPTE